MEKTIEEHRLEFLNETIQYYSEDTSRRAINEKSNRCRYRTSDGRKCAVGRHIPDDKYNINIESYPIREVMERLPIEIQELGDKFLLKMQGLHDYVPYWDHNGLTEMGEHCVNDIINEYCK